MTHKEGSFFDTTINFVQNTVLCALSSFSNKISAGRGLVGVCVGVARKQLDNWLFLVMKGMVDFFVRFEQVFRSFTFRVDQRGECHRFVCKHFEQNEPINITGRLPVIVN